MKHIYLLTLLASQAMTPQKNSFNIPDSLSRRDYTYLRQGVESNALDSAKCKVYGQAWINKSKSARDWPQAALAYRSVMFRSAKNLLLAYSDSLLVVSRRTMDDLLIGSAYLTKGIVYYDLKYHNNALDNYLFADAYLSRTNDQYAIHKVKFAIAQTKLYLGFNYEAISLFSECRDYFEAENDRAYLNTLHALGICYNRIGEYEKCSRMNDCALKAGNQFLSPEMKPYILHSEGINQFSKQNYTNAIQTLHRALPDISSKKDFANESVAWFYIASSYRALGKLKLAMPYFNKVDKVFARHHYIRPDQRETYEVFINHYKEIGDRDKQLFYIERLLAVDRLLNSNYKYLSGRIFKEYDTKKLLASKKEIEDSMKLRSAIDYGVILLLIGMVLLMIQRQYRNKKKFKMLMNPPRPKSIKVPMNDNSNKDTDFEIGTEVVNGILRNLEKFEESKKYLEKDMTLNKMASILNTNTKYVSKIVLRYRNKKTIEYINGLKIDYIVELLKTENKFRNYTNKALGEEAGFGSTQNFTRAFTSSTGISPTYFIRKLKKEITAGKIEP